MSYTNKPLYIDTPNNSDILRIAHAGIICHLIVVKLI